jgi:hypothetical protein
MAPLAWARNSSKQFFVFLIYLIHPAALSPGVYSACNRNDYQKQKTNFSGEWSAAGA